MRLRRRRELFRDGLFVRREGIQTFYDAALDDENLLRHAFDKVLIVTHQDHAAFKVSIADASASHDSKSRLLVGSSRMIRCGF